MTLAELFAWVFAASTSVTDGKGTDANHHLRAISRDGALAIAEGCLRSPLYEGDDGRKCGSTLLEMAGRESNYTPSAIGDNHHAFGAFQTHYPEPYAKDEFLLHWDWQVDIAIIQLRQSIRKCAKHPLAPYARGWCGDVEGQSISDERMSEIKRIHSQLSLDVFSSTQVTQ